MSTIERLSALLERDFEVRRDALQSQATLESLDIDSLRMIEILFRIEDEFGIRVPSEPAELRERLRTLGDLAGYVDELIARPAKADA